MYKLYLSRQPGLTPSKANFFASSEEIGSMLGLDMDPDDLAELIWAIGKKEYLVIDDKGDDMPLDIALRMECAMSFHSYLA